MKDKNNKDKKQDDFLVIARKILELTNKSRNINQMNIASLEAESINFLSKYGRCKTSETILKSIGRLKKAEDQFDKSIRKILNEIDAVQKEEQKEKNKRILDDVLSEAEDF
jgi:hypothetical protein